METILVVFIACPDLIYDIP